LKSTPLTIITRTPHSVELDAQIVFEFGGLTRAVSALVTGQQEETCFQMNAINVIAPYKHNGQWVFDDSRVGLSQEPFVAGADTWIDRVVADIPNAAQGRQTPNRHRLARTRTHAYFQETHYDK
jgi:hypothetical protein